MRSVAKDLIEYDLKLNSRLPFVMVEGVVWGIRHKLDHKVSEVIADNLWSILWDKVRELV